MTSSSRLQGYPDPGPGLRLHLNENTGGCSPKVLEAIRRVDPRDVSTYPSYPDAHSRLRAATSTSTRSGSC